MRSKTYWWTRLAVCVCVYVPDILRAATNEPAAVDAEAAFAILREYITLPTSTGQYVRLERYGDLEVRAALPSLEANGNAWLLQEFRDAQGQPEKGLLLINGAELVEFQWRGNRPRGQWPGEAALASAPPAAEWYPAPLGRDLRRAWFFMRDYAQHPPPPGFRAEQWAGRSLLFAYQLEALGQSTAARELVQWLNDLQNIQVDPLHEAVNLLANARYLRLYREFKSDGNWETFGRGLEALLADPVASDWEWAPGVALLRQRIEQRPRQPEATNGLAGIRDLRRSDAYSKSGVPWLAPTYWTNTIPVLDDPDLALRAQGLDALPTLIAWVDDPTLCVIDAFDLRGEYRSYRRDSLRLIFDEEAERTVEEIERPATCGEAARRILWEILPDAAAGGLEMFMRDSACAKEKAQSFYDRAKDYSEDELVLEYLFGDYRDSKIETQIMEAAKARRIPAFENYLIEKRSNATNDRYARDPAGELEKRANLMMRYAAIRGPEVRDLAQQLGQMLDTAAEEYKLPRHIGFGSDESRLEYIASRQNTLRTASQQLQALFPAEPAVKKEP